MAQAAQTSTAPPWNWRSSHAQFAVGSVSHMPADCGGVLQGARETRHRLVADTRFLSRIPGAPVRRIPCVGKARDPSQHEGRSFLGWNCP